jgi:hypothetical protein
MALRDGTELLTTLAAGERHQNASPLADLDETLSIVHPTYLRDKSSPYLRKRRDPHQAGHRLQLKHPHKRSSRITASWQEPPPHQVAQEAEQLMEMMRPMINQELGLPVSCLEDMMWQHLAKFGAIIEFALARAMPACNDTSAHLVHTKQHAPLHNSQ